MLSWTGAPSMTDLPLIHFPGRIRQFAGGDPGTALALAVGCAWCESRRGGLVLAVVPPEDRAHPLVVRARALASRLGLSCLREVATADPGVASEPFAPAERQPVHLASLGRELRPSWPAGTDALAWLAAAEPALLAPGGDPQWGCDEATLLALAWIAGDGRRVVWRLPAGQDPGGWSASLALIGRMQLPLKLIVPADVLPWADPGLDRWWVAAAGGTEASSVLAWALSGEECCLLSLDAPSAPGWADGMAWVPGSARTLADGGGAGTLLCTAIDAVPALAVGEALDLPVIQLTSLNPLPTPVLRSATARGPVFAMGEDLARLIATRGGLEPGAGVRLAPRDARAAASILAGGSPGLAGAPAYPATRP